MLCAAGIALSAALFGPATIFETYVAHSDFIGFYTSGTLAFTGNLYDVGAFMQAQGRATGRISDQLLFARLPWQAVLFAPLTAMSFATARIVWTGICLLALGVFGACWPAIPVSARLLAVCWTIPVFMGFIIGQDVPVVLAALGLGFHCMERGRPMAGGLCLAFCMAKPHLFWPLAAILVFHRMWRVCAGGAIGVAALGALSFLSGGLEWPGRFTNLLRFVDTKAHLSVMPTLHSALLGVKYGGAIEGAIVLVLIALAGLTPDWKQGVAGALVIGILAGRHAFLSDCAFLLAALFLCWPLARRRTVLLLLLSPFVFVPAILGHPAWPVLAMTVGALFLTWPGMSVCLIKYVRTYATENHGTAGREPAGAG
jgi:hypothetical protein